MTEQELKDILKALEKAYAKAGRTVSTATLIQGEEETLVIDNRKPEDLN